MALALRLAGLVLASMMFSACASGASRANEEWPTAPLSRSLSMSEVIRGVNAVRAQHRLQKLRPDARLADAAAEQAGYQAATQKMSHYGYRGARLEERLVRSSYDYRIAGENVSVGRTTEASVVAAWMRSPTHREMMLHPEITEIGVAAAIGPRGRVYWSMVMADPAPRQAGRGPRDGNVVFW